MKNVHDDMNLLQRANNSKTYKLKNLNKTNTQLLETLHKNEEQLHKKLEVFKQEHLNEETIQKSVINMIQINFGKSKVGKRKKKYIFENTLANVFTNGRKNSLHH